MHYALKKIEKKVSDIEFEMSYLSRAVERWRAIAAEALEQRDEALQQRDALLKRLSAGELNE